MLHIILYFCLFASLNVCGSDEIYEHYQRVHEPSDLDKFMDRYGLPLPAQHEVEKCLEDASCRAILQKRYTSKVATRFIEHPQHPDDEGCYRNVANPDYTGFDLMDYEYQKGVIENPAGFILKQDIDRIINARRLQNCIRSLGMQRLTVPNKYIYFISPGEYRVFCQKVDGSPADDISLAEIQELARLVQVTGYSDFGFYYALNLYRDNQTRKLVFIDTEGDSFFQFFEYLDTKQRKLPVATPLAAMLNLSARLAPRLQADARLWLTETINEMLKKNQGVYHRAVLPDNPAYDDRDIDFEQVKYELFVHQSKN